MGTARSVAFLHDKSETPPAVEHLRRSLRDSRMGRFVARRKTLAAVVVALLAVLKVARLAVIEIAWVARHPDEALAWSGDHWLLLTIGALTVFVVAFVSAKLGINWLTDDTQDQPSRIETGPGWSQRPPDRGMDHVPRAG